MLTSALKGGLDMRVRVGVLTVLLSMALVGTAAAQGTTSRLAGQVTDSTGAVMPGVTVTLTNDGTGVSFSTVTTAAGAYVFEALPSGSYTVKFELQGFKTLTSKGNRVAIGQPTSVDAQMAPGELSETVQVTGRMETVQTSNSGNLGSVVDQRTLEAFPLVSGGGRGRNPLDMVLIQPGVVSGANTGGGTHVNGARDRSWNYTLDGIDTNETSAGGSNFSPLRTNPDSLSEFKILTGNTTAEFGRNSGGQVAMITLKYGDPWLRIPPREYAAAKFSIADSMLRSAERLYPGLRPRIEEMEIATPLTFLRYLGHPRGSIYGFDHYIKDWDVFSPGGPPIKGLYSAGGWTGLCGFQPTLQSGVVAAKQALREIR